MKLFEAEMIIKELGFTIKSVMGCYRLTYKVGDEANSYFTPSLHDAVRMAIVMSEKKEVL